MNDTRRYKITASTNPIIREIDLAVVNAKQDQKWRDTFMTHLIDEQRAEQRGELEKAKEIAENMLDLNLPLSVVVAATGLTEEFVEDIRKGMLSKKRI